MRGKIVAVLIALIQCLHRRLLRAFPRAFRHRFGEEMDAVLRMRLAAAEERGTWAILGLGIREVAPMPAVALRLHLHGLQRRWRRLRALLAHTGPPAFFTLPPPAADGRFSVGQFLFEVGPFLFTAFLIGWLTYRSPPWLSAAWRDPTGASALLWAGVVPALALLLGFARGLPRWAYPHAGLLVGHTLWLAAGHRLLWLWAVLFAMALALVIMAVLLHPRGRPLPPFLRRLGASIALDWTRLSFGLFGAAPFLILAAFDNAFLDGRTPYLALALLVMVLAAAVYARRRRQDHQLAALLGGATLLLLPALLDHLHWLGGASNVRWLVILWVWAVAILTLPILTVPVQWASDLAPRRPAKE